MEFSRKPQIKLKLFLGFCLFGLVFVCLLGVFFFFREVKHQLFCVTCNRLLSKYFTRVMIIAVAWLPCGWPLAPGPVLNGSAFRSQLHPVSKQQ